ncbi:MAG: serine/threonine-protein kinase [Nostoc sp.]|uniref:serine/threonine-protein kinase n=1 Tax=Nostoc sp. TaxID=1180 RepID=UPI002FFD3C97
MFWVPGEKLEGGKYIVQKVLGQGGFGITYLAKDIYLDRNVVLKTFNKKITYNINLPKFEEKFTNEAKILGNLVNFRHSNIVQLYECFKEDQLLCLVMEYIEGENLYKIVTQKGALDEREALKYIQQIGSALIAVHEQNFIHLDVNPNNILLRTGKSEVVLIDFGNVLNFKNASTTELLPTSQGYSPSEQYTTKLKLGTYSDVYSLAATLYFLLTRTTPISSIDIFLGQELNFPKNLKIRDSIKRAILTGMSLESENRPQSVQEWLGLLPTTSSSNDSPSIHSIRDYSKRKSVLSLQTNDDLSSEYNVDYTRLRDLLAAEKWKEADKETFDIMLKVTGRIEKSCLSSESIENFPYTDLHTIDKLWVGYSSERFGFSIQKRIWKSVDYNFKQFRAQVGWKTFLGFNTQKKDARGHYPVQFAQRRSIWFFGIEKGWRKRIMPHIYIFIVGLIPLLLLHFIVPKYNRKIVVYLFAILD